jgi:hypothetical protein
MRPLTPERFKMQFTVSRETYDQLRHAQDLDAPLDIEFRCRAHN